MKLTFNTVAREICKREKSESREVNITDVKRVMRHLFDILEDEQQAWQKRPGAAPFSAYVVEELSARGENVSPALSFYAEQHVRARKSKRPTGKGSKP